MWVDNVIGRLRAQVSALRKVSGAVDFASATPDLKATPVAYVVPLAEAAGPNALANQVRQKMEVHFGVIFAIGSLRDARGEAAKEALEPLRAAVRSALLGWTPDTGFNPIYCTGGRLVDMSEGILWWQDDFTTSFYIHA